jgi:hypothetical protein
LSGTRTFQAFGNGQSVSFKKFKYKNKMETTAQKNAGLADAKKWWNETDFRQMALITGFRQYEYSPEDGCQAFVDACDNWWNSLDRNEKIRIWQENREQDYYYEH